MVGLGEGRAMRAIMAHKIMASWLAGRRSYYPETLVIPS